MCVRFVLFSVRYQTVVTASIDVKTLLIAFTWPRWFRASCRLQKTHRALNFIRTLFGVQVGASSFFPRTDLHIMSRRFLWLHLVWLALFLCSLVATSGGCLCVIRWPPTAFIIGQFIMLQSFVHGTFHFFSSAHRMEPMHSYGRLVCETVAPY